MSSRVVLEFRVGFMVQIPIGKITSPDHLTLVVEIAGL
jgi:hypothetical protein